MKDIFIEVNLAQFFQELSSWTASGCTRSEYVEMVLSVLDNYEAVQEYRTRTAQ